MIWLPWLVTLAAVLLAGGALRFAWYAEERAKEAREDARYYGRTSLEHEREANALREALVDAERRARHRESKASRRTAAALPTLNEESSNAH